MFRILSVLVTLFVAACSSDSNRCIEGSTSACICTNGQAGSQTCLPDGKFAPCQCEGSVDDGGAIVGDGEMPDGFVEESGPVFLSFGTNVNALTVGESLVFSAVVTDPDGIDDLIGGTLKGSGNIQYGSFSTSAQEGAYSMTLSWAQVHQTDPLEFVGEEYRTFVAEFFDVAGHRATQTIQIRFWCEVAACNGGCHDINNDVTACGSSCKNCSSDDKWGYPQCVEGSCIGAYEFSTVASCDDHCSNKGGVCIKPAKPSEIESCDAMFSISGAEGIYSYYPDGANPSIKYYECSETPAATKSPDIPFVEIRCCCKY